MCGSVEISAVKDNAHKFSVILYLLLVLPLSASAAWNVTKRSNPDTNAVTTTATTTNADGYTLEIYRDSIGAVRSRFTLRNGLLSLAEHNCPTYQVDKAVPVDRSANDTPCISNTHWAEFVLGYVKSNAIDSPRLLALMNGITITYRFHLAEGGYRETSFSLSGSKRSVLAAIGPNVSTKAN